MKEGDRVELIVFAVEDDFDDNALVPAGTQGVIDFIDDAGTLHVNWDNGYRLGLLPDVDQYKEV